MANPKIQARKESLILRELNIILQREIQNELLKLINVVEVRLSKDAEHAKIYYTYIVIDKEITKEIVDNEIQKNLKTIRMLLARKNDFRVVPSLTFVYDQSLENANRIEEILKETKEKK